MSDCHFSLFYSCGLIASTGQVDAHEPQSIQSPPITYWLSLSVMALTGHTDAHAPQDTHCSEITYIFFSPPLQVIAVIIDIANNGYMHRFRYCNHCHISFAMFISIRRRNACTV